MSNQFEVIVGALIAALILLLSNIVTLFNQDANLTFAMIKQSAWVAIAGGALIQFLKDYQAVSTRRAISAFIPGREIYTTAAPPDKDPNVEEKPVKEKT